MIFILFINSQRFLSHSRLRMIISLTCHSKGTLWFRIRISISQPNILFYWMSMISNFYCFLQSHILRIILKFILRLCSFIIHIQFTFLFCLRNRSLNHSILISVSLRLYLIFIFILWSLSSRFLIIKFINCFRSEGIRRIRSKYLSIDI